MKRLVFVLPLLLSSDAWAKTEKPKTPKKKAAQEVSASTTAPAGLPTYAPSTAPVTVQLIIDRLQALDEGMKSLSADFRQHVKMEEAGTEQTIEGAVSYGKPSLLRVEHFRPERQTVVADGQWLWVYRQQTNQVIQTSFDEWRKSEPLAQGLMDFGGYASLLKRYAVEIATISAPAPDGHRTVSLLLKPKDKDEAFALRLDLSTKDFFPAHAELAAGRIRILSHFSNVKFNPDLPPSLFKFSPPAGADVFRKSKSL